MSNYETDLTRIWINQDSDYWDFIDAENLEIRIILYIEGFMTGEVGLKRDLLKASINKVDVKKIVDEMIKERKL